MDMFIYGKKSEVATELKLQCSFPEYAEHEVSSGPQGRPVNPISYS